MTQIVLYVHPSLIIGSRCRDAAGGEYAECDAEQENQQHGKPEGGHGVQNQ